MAIDTIPAEFTFEEEESGVLDVELDKPIPYTIFTRFLVSVVSAERLTGRTVTRNLIVLADSPSEAQGIVLAFLQDNHEVKQIWQTIYAGDWIPERCDIVNDPTGDVTREEYDKDVRAPWYPEGLQKPTKLGPSD